MTNFEKIKSIETIAEIFYGVDGSNAAFDYIEDIKAVLDEMD